jgi:hypothetical protein
MPINGWNARTSGVAVTLLDTVFGDSLNVVSGAGTILTSPDALAWTSRTTGTVEWLSGIARSAGDDIFVTVGGAGVILSSPDAITWTSRTSGVSEWLNAVTYGSPDDLFVAVGDLGTILTSPNGVTWTARTSGTVEFLLGVTYGASDDLYVAVGAAGTILTSPDGVTWTVRTSGVATDLNAVTHDGSQFIVVGDGGVVLTSPDGVTWTSRTSGTANDLVGAAFGDSEIVAVGASGTIIKSADGVTWVASVSGTSEFMSGVSYNATGNYFIAVGSAGKILQSTLLIEMDLQSTGLVASSQTLVKVLIMELESAGLVTSVHSSTGIWLLELQSTGSLVSSIGFHVDIFMILNSTGTLESAYVMARSQALELMSQLTGLSNLTLIGIYGLSIQSDMSALSLHMANVDDLPDLHEDGVVWVVNMDTNASSQYEQYGFNSFFTRNGIHYGVADDGIYELSGDDDAGQPIEALAMLPKSNLGDGYLKNVPNFYVGVSSTGKMILKANADGQEYLYEARSSSEDLKTHRFDLGRGLEGTFWQFTLMNQEGCDFNIADIEFTPVVRRRRI